MSVYPTKRDWWLMAILWPIAVFFIYVSLTVHNEPAAPWMKVFATCFFGIFGLLTAALAFLPNFITYALDPMYLTIKVGPFSSKIEIAQITEVYPTKNPLSAPALSLDRLRVRFSSSGFGALISPVRKQAFMEELAGYAPHLQRNGDRLVKIDT